MREILCRDPVPISLQVVSITFILYLYTLTDDYLCSARDGWLLASAEAPVALPWLARGWLGVIEDTFASPVSRLRLRCFPRCGYRVDRGEWLVRLLVSSLFGLFLDFMITPLPLVARTSHWIRTDSDRLVSTIQLLF